MAGRDKDNQQIAQGMAGSAWVRHRQPGHAGARHGEAGQGQPTNRSWQRLASFALAWRGELWLGAVGQGKTTNT
jgi:hypothetical protein